MFASLEGIVLAVAVIGLTKCQESFVFEMLATASFDESKLVEQKTGIHSVIDCARMCTLKSSCAFVQYCMNGDTCALYEKCANCTANFTSCSNGNPPITVSRHQHTTSAISTTHSAISTTQSAMSPPQSANSTTQSAISTTQSAISTTPLPANVCGADKYLVTGPDGVDDSQLSASSIYCYVSPIPDYCPDCLKPKYARLNSTGGCGSWAPQTQSSTDYIQVDFQTTKQATGIELASRADPKQSQYVTKFKVQYSIDCVNFNHVQDGSNNDKVFDGSSTAGEVVTRCFDQPIPAKCIRINPTAYEFYPSLRFDVLGY